MNPTEVRLQLLQAGFHPLPLFGKAPSMLKNWQERLHTNNEEIAMWAKQWPDAINTGVLTKMTPAFDIDILHLEAAEAVEALVRDRFEERGYFLSRIGKPPKRAIMFRTDAPFPKINRPLIAPDGSEQKLEFLADGQQIVVDGIHPDTKRPYGWHGGVPGEIAREHLPYITGAEAQQLVDDAAKLLIDEFGFREKQKPKANGDGAAHDQAGPKWDHYQDNLIDHDVLTEYAAALISAGMTEAAAINYLRSQVERVATADLERKNRRLSEIPGMVRSAAQKFGGRAEQQAEQQPEFTSPNEGKAFGYEWRLRWHGDVNPIDSRPQLIEGLVPEIGVGLISGQWGTYKTFVGFDLAGSLISGNTFINFPVRRKGGVLFIACEGQSEVAIRLQAVVEAKCPNMQRAPFAWLDNCPRLLDPNAGKIIAAIIRQAADRMMADFGVPLALVIIDTAGKAAGYTKSGDENDAALSKIIMRALATAALEARCFIFGVDHFGKNVETGTRGSSSKEDDADVVLALLGEKNLAGAITNSRLAIRKRRSGSNGEEFPFRTKLVDMGIDEYGQSQTTLLIDWKGSTEPATPKSNADPWSKSLRLLRQTLMTMLVDCGQDVRPYPDGPIVQAVDVEMVRREFYASYLADGSPEQKAAAKRQAFNRVIKDARDRGLVQTRSVNGADMIWLTTAQQAPT